MTLHFRQCRYCLPTLKLRGRKVTWITPKNHPDHVWTLCGQKVAWVWTTELGIPTCRKCLRLLREFCDEMTDEKVRAEIARGDHEENE